MCKSQSRQRKISSAETSAASEFGMIAIAGNSTCSWGGWFREIWNQEGTNNDSLQKDSVSDRLFRQRRSSAGTRLEARRFRRWRGHCSARCCRLLRQASALGHALRPSRAAETYGWLCRSAHVEAAEKGPGSSTRANS